MKTYLISKVNFLEWYFKSGQDSENELIKDDMTNRLVNGLFNKNKFQITTRDIFNECNKNAIRLGFIDGFNIDYNKEGEDLGDIYRDWETDRKSTRLNSSHSAKSRMPSSA